MDKKYLNKRGLSRLIELMKFGKRQIWHGTQEEWDALTAEEKDKYDQAEIIDANGITAVDKVEEGNMNPVTSNAVYYANQIRPRLFTIKPVTGFTLQRGRLDLDDFGNGSIVVDFGYNETQNVAIDVNNPTKIADITFPEFTKDMAFTGRFPFETLSGGKTVWGHINKQAGTVTGNVTAWVNSSNSEVGHWLWSCTMPLSNQAIEAV